MLTVVGLVGEERAVGDGITERRMLAVHVVTASKGALAALGSSRGIRGRAFAGEDLAVVGEGEDRGRKVMGSAIMNPSSAILNRQARRVRLGRLALIVDFDPDGRLVSALLEGDAVGEIADDGGCGGDGLG